MQMAQWWFMIVFCIKQEMLLQYAFNSSGKGSHTVQLSAEKLLTG